MWAQFFDTIAGAANNSIDLAWHSLWIGTVLALSCWIVTRFVRNLTTANRYNIWFSVLIIVVALPLMTGIATKVTLPDLSTLWQTETEPLAINADATPSKSSIDAKATHQTDLSKSTGSTIIQSPTAQPRDEIKADRNREPHRDTQLAASSSSEAESVDYWTLANTLLPIYALIVWFGVTLLLLARLLHGYLVLNHIKKHALPFDPLIDRYFQSLVRKMQIKRKVYLCHSSEVNMPMAAGYFSSHVIFPRNLVPQLTNSELQDILLHELAHIKRYDDFGKLFQRIFEAIFFFNPIIRVIGHQLAFEREIACDDAVVRMTKRPQDYARCLTRLVEMTSGPRFALAPGAILSRKQLFRRFDMILNSSRNTFGRVSRLVLASSLVLIVTIGAACLIISPAIAFSPGGMSYVELSQMLNERLGIEPEMPDETNEVQPVAEPEMQIASIVLEQPDNEKEPEPLGYIEQPRETKKASKEPKAPAYASIDDVVADVDRSPDAIGIGSSSQYTKQSHQKGSYDDAIRNFERSVSGIFSGNVINNHDGGWTYYHNKGRKKILIDVDGEYEISEDLKTIKPVGRGSSIVIEERSRSHSTELYLELDRDGNEVVEYYLDGDSAEYDQEGKEWLEELLLFAAYNSGAWTDKHIALLLKEGGVDHVLEVIEEFDSDYTKRKYYQELLLQAEINNEQLGQILRTVERNIDSDYEKAELLIALSREYEADRMFAGEFVDAIRSLDSDYETRRVLSEMAFDDPVDPKVVIGVLDLAREMNSDYERAELLLDMADFSREDAEARRAYYNAVDEMSSDYETRRVLTELGLSAEIDETELRQVLMISSRMSSDYEKAELLMDLADVKAMDANTQSLIIDEIASMSSDYEKRRVLESLTFSEDPSDEYVEKALRMTHEISSDFERSNLLSDMIDLVEDRPALHLKWLDAAGDISSDYELSNLLTSFVRTVDMSDEVTLETIRLADQISSDYDKSRLLKRLEKYVGDNEELKAAFEDVVESISSDYERQKFDRRGRRSY